MSSSQVLIHNAVKGNFEIFLNGNPEWLEANFIINTTSLMYLAHYLLPDMIYNQKGVIIFTGNTAAHRGMPLTPYFAPTKAAQRILTQSLAREFGPKGVHVAYLTIDASINTPWIRTRIEHQKTKKKRNLHSQKILQMKYFIFRSKKDLLGHLMLN